MYKHRLCAALNSWMLATKRAVVLDFLFYLYICTNMKINTSITQLSALAQTTRLETFRLLVKRGEAGLPAGEIASKLNVNVTTLSRHLAVMENAGLLTRERCARQIIYRVAFGAVRGLFTFLLEDCCASDPRIMTNACKPEAVTSGGFTSEIRN